MGNRRKKKRQRRRQEKRFEKRIFSQNRVFDPTTLHYKEGWFYYSRGGRNPDDANPYDRGTRKRSEWFAGYYEARIHFKLNHVFERYGMRNLYLRS